MCDSCYALCKLRVIACLCVLQWKTIVCSVVCCGCASLPTSAAELKAEDGQMAEYLKAKGAAREVAVHPSDSSIALTLHQPLYPPGRIIHIVRHHPTKGE